VEKLFREHNDALIGFLRARLHSEADAKEAAQEAYVRLLQLDQPGQPSFLRAYLFKVASNVATDLMRRRAMTARHARANPYDDTGAALQEQAMVAREQLALIDAALRELPPRCREAFLLSRYEGMGTLQIAERLGVTDRMIRTYLVRALEHVQQALARAGGAA
jgi:RNA polymerase sigma-70 factor (ECF subfamily)